MGKLFDLTDDVLQVAQDGLDDLIDLLGKSCTLHFPPKWTPITTGDTDTPLPAGYEDASVWVNGGLISPDGTGGSSQRAIETTETIKLLIQWSPQTYYLKPGPGTVVPDGSIQTKGYITDLDSVMKASYLTIQNALADRLRLKFERLGDPIDPSNIIQGRYFICNWRRVA